MCSIDDKLNEIVLAKYAGMEKTCCNLPTDLSFFVDRYEQRDQFRDRLTIVYPPSGKTKPVRPLIFLIPGMNCQCHYSLRMRFLEYEIEAFRMALGGTIPGPDRHGIKRLSPYVDTKNAWNKLSTLNHIAKKLIIPNIAKNANKNGLEEKIKEHIDQDQAMGPLLYVDSISPENVANSQEFIKNWLEYWTKLEFTKGRAAIVFLEIVYKDNMFDILHNFNKKSPRNMLTQHLKSLRKEYAANPNVVIWNDLPAITLEDAEVWAQWVHGLFPEVAYPTLTVKIKKIFRIWNHIVSYKSLAAKLTADPKDS